ncbi:MAG: T9SS type A sorting domain-containing protein [Flavobacteriales bacterium]|nr:T9SS type A sorting domain-containing protein [Flavobacteriales bacterium]
MNVECADDVPAAPSVEATDNCSDVTITSDSDMDMDECGNYVETITYTATDACGNASSISYMVTVNDITAPELEGLPAQSLVLDCEDEVPAPEEVTALDNCEGIIEVNFNEELIGDLPAEGSSADCAALTPEGDENGEVCTGEDTWSLKLFNFNGLNAALYSTIEANWVEYPDGSATLSGMVVSNVDPNRGWNIDVEFENGMDWAGWSTQGFPTSYKDDCNEAGDNYLDWTYYIMSAGATLTGWGDFDGATLNISHAPSNYYYGYQVGTAANNVNVNYGGGGWFTYSGIFNDMEVSGSGDFAFDHDCCPQYSIERTWCAVDCSGNETCFTQTITFADLGINPPVAGGGAGEAQEDIAKGGTEDVTRISAYPNPAMNKAFVEFTLAETAVAHVEIFSLNGQKVADLYNANAEANELYRVEFNAAELPVGVYLYRLTTENEVITDRIIINK